jgi:CBS domain-containing protein
MTDKLKLAENLEPFVLIPPSASVAEALAMLQEADATFAVVGDANHPQTLAQEDHLAALVDEASRPLTELLDRLPPLLVVDGEVEDLDVKDLKQFARLLQQTRAPGLVVYQDNQVTGVVPRSAIARALPLTAITSTSTKRLYGDANVPARTFICRKCSPPSPRRRPRQGDEAPICPRDWLHGPMEREYL